MSTESESKGPLSALVDPCYKGCNHHYEALLNIPWRVYCKKGCNADGDSWKECKEECRETCYKDPLISGDSLWSHLSASLDRSPGVPNQSLRCYKACLWGCAVRFHVPDEWYDAAVSEDPVIEHKGAAFAAAAHVAILPANEEQSQGGDTFSPATLSAVPDEQPSPVSEASA